MTLRDLLKLPALQGAFSTDLLPDSDAIRHRWIVDASGAPACPIVAACALLTDHAFSNFAWDGALVRLGIYPTTDDCRHRARLRRPDELDPYDLVAAADRDTTWPEARDLRVELIAILVDAPPVPEAHATETTARARRELAELPALDALVANALDAEIGQ